jgi:gentisate 1,2-dioxygenase
MPPSALDLKPTTSADRQEYYQRLDKKDAAPLWEVLADIVTPAPKTSCVPAIWRYEEMRPLLMEAGELITAKEAERRVLVLENPGIRGTSQITQSLYAGLQLVQPGETAPTHRHTASALRFVLESEGGYTAVDGERTTMHPGDFIVTRPWTYHDHGNNTSKPIIWLDVLDIPIVNQLCCSFAEHYEQETQPLTRPEGDSLDRFGSNMVPLDFTPKGLDSPVLSYSWEQSRETLHRMSRSGPVHPSHGIKMQFVNPVTGGYAMTTIGTFLQLLPSGFAGKPYRSTDATIYCVAEGEGESTIGDRTFVWRRHDVFVVPSWHPVSHKVNSEAVLFSASDRPVQKMLRMWREQA